MGCNTSDNVATMVWWVPKNYCSPGNPCPRKILATVAVMDTWLESSGKWEVDFSDERLTNFKKGFPWDFHGFPNAEVPQFHGAAIFFRMVSERFPAIFARALSRTTLPNIKLQRQPATTSFSKLTIPPPELRIWSKILSQTSMVWIRVQVLEGNNMWQGCVSVS